MKLVIPWTDNRFTQETFHLKNQCRREIERNKHFRQKHNQFSHRYYTLSPKLYPILHFFFFFRVFMCVLILYCQTDKNKIISGSVCSISTPSYPKHCIQHSLKVNDSQSTVSQSAQYTLHILANWLLSTLSGIGVPKCLSTCFFSSLLSWAHFQLCLDVASFRS